MLWSNSACSYHPSLEQDFNPASKPSRQGGPPLFSLTHTHTQGRADRFAAEPGWLSFPTCNPSRHTRKHNSLQLRLGMWQSHMKDEACLFSFISLVPSFFPLSFSPLFCAIASLVHSPVWLLWHMEGERKPEALRLPHLALVPQREHVFFDGPGRNCV